MNGPRILMARAFVFHNFTAEELSRFDDSGRTQILKKLGGTDTTLPYVAYMVNFPDSGDEHLNPEPLPELNYDPYSTERPSTGPERDRWNADCDLFDKLEIRTYRQKATSPRELEWWIVPHYCPYQAVFITLPSVRALFPERQFSIGSSHSHVFVFSMEGELMTIYDPLHQASINAGFPPNEEDFYLGGLEIIKPEDGPVWLKENYE